MPPKSDRLGKDAGFKCGVCGSVRLRVEHTFSETQGFVARLDCNCGGNAEMAAERHFQVVTVYSESGDLEEDHHWKFGRPEKIEVLPEEKLSYEVFCPDCVAEAASGDWDQVEDDDVVEKATVDWYVRCEGCGREIEFGWSHPDRAGRIWPAECADFNPYKTWPEPRYEAAWARKGWLRPRN